MTLIERFGFCSHKWKELNCNKLLITGTNIQVGYLYVLQCEKCGKLKHKKLLL